MIGAAVIAMVTDGVAVAAMDADVAAGAMAHRQCSRARMLSRHHNQWLGRGRIGAEMMEAVVIAVAGAVIAGNSLRVTQCRRVMEPRRPPHHARNRVRNHAHNALRVESGRTGTTASSWIDAGFRS
jgi:hypothetical protein